MIIQGKIMTIMNKTIRYMDTEDTSTGTITIVVEDIQVEADSLGIEKIDHDDRSSVTCA